MNASRAIEGLRPFFKPASVAVIGASRTPGKGGYNVIENLLRLGYGGKIIPVNPQAREILGIEAYPDLLSAPEAPELAIVLLPPGRVKKSLEECIARGVKAVIIESAGFAEMDYNGARAQREIAGIAAEAGIRVMGPNSVGTINPYANFDTSLGRLNKLFLPQGDIRRGRVAFVGQTGLYTGVFLPLINSEFGISKVACLGNKCDIDECDMLEYVGRDPATEVITMYLESINDGQRFLELGRRIGKKKPIIVLKSAVTAPGARTSLSHTGSMAGENAIYDVAFRQVGIIRVDSFPQLWDTTRAFVNGPMPPGNRVAIINLAGSGCVTSVDTCARYGLEIADLSLETRAKIKTVYPDWWHVRSPVDVWTAVEFAGFEITYRTITRAVLEDDGVDAVLIIMGAIDWLPGKEVPALFEDIRKEFPAKPIMAVNPLGDRDIYNVMFRGFQAIGIPAYASDEEAIASLAAVYRYRQYRERTG